jgi:hypothetical protein
MKVHHKRIHDESISGVEVDCEECGQSIRRRSSRVQSYDVLFCNDECKRAYFSKNHPLEGTERPEHAELMSEMHSGEDNPMYGVRGEDAPNWQGGEQMVQNWRRSSEWLEARRQAKERDDGECQVCGQSEDLHAHHIQPVSEGGEKFDTDNLIMLCAEHHYDRHRA